MNTTIESRPLDELVSLGGKFLRAASVKPEIMQLLLALGYTEAEHKQGWDLYLKMLGYVGADKIPTVRASSTDQLQALTRIDHFDEPAFRRATVALERLHPDQHQYMFGDGLSAKTGPAAVGSVQCFIDRYAALRDGTDPARSATREADRAAAATLEARNIINPETEQELRGLIELVKSPATFPSTPVVSEDAAQGAAREFQSWLYDWRTTAAAGISRRDYRIMLGISRRRVSKAAAATSPSTGAAAPEGAEGAES